MFYRDALIQLRKWRQSEGRKPLIIRGARQVGKTTLVRQFSEEFRQFIYMNLELQEDRSPFAAFTSAESLLEAIFFLKNQSRQFQSDTLLFIDEIQAVPEALNVLRYLYEHAPGLAVIAAGSVLESLFNTDTQFPVGRVSYLVLRPVSFPEFLNALGEDAALEQLQHVPLRTFAHEKLMGLYRTYALIGGMPEIVSRYSRDRDLTSLSSVFDGLIASYLDDVEKYADSQTSAGHIRHVIRSSFGSAGKRIKFEGFGASAYKSREMGEALRIAEKAFLLNLIYPVTSTKLPVMPVLDRSPKLQLLDTGLLNYYVGIQKDIVGTKDLADVYQGTLIEHLTGQELIAFQYDALSSLHFWVREKTSSTAEVDFIFQFEGRLIPVEAKSGATGKLRSLHLYMNEAPHDLAIRFYSGMISMHEASTSGGKKYRLLNLPYYLVSQLKSYLEWGINLHVATEQYPLT